MINRQNLKARFGLFVMLFWFVSAFMMLNLNMSFASEREIVLSEEYQTKEEKELLLKNKYRNDISLHNSYIPPYFDNIIVLDLSTTYVANPRTGVYISIPFCLAEITEKQYIVQYVWLTKKYKAGLGDIYGGIYYHLLANSKTNTIANFEVSSNTGKRPFGNNSWDLSLFTQTRKKISESLYLCGIAEGTYLLNSNYFPYWGEFLKTGYGGGIGIFIKNGIIELKLKANQDLLLDWAYDTQPAPYGGPLLIKGDKVWSWSERKFDFNFTFKFGFFGPGTTTLIFHDIKEGFSWKRFTYDMSYSIGFSD